MNDQPSPDPTLHVSVEAPIPAVQTWVRALGVVCGSTEVVVKQDSSGGWGLFHPHGGGMVCQPREDRPYEDAVLEANLYVREEETRKRMGRSMSAFLDEYLGAIRERATGKPE